MEISRVESNQATGSTPGGGLPSNLRIRSEQLAQSELLLSTSGFPLISTWPGIVQFSIFNFQLSFSQAPLIYVKVPIIGTILS